MMKISVSRKNKAFLKSNTQNLPVKVLYLYDLEQSESLRTIVVPLIVPTKEEAVNVRNLDLSNSPLNACYAKPLFNEKTGQKQSGYEVRLTIEDQANLPAKEEWFYLVTDSAYIFKARFEGENVKCLCSFENIKAIGLFIKGRLVECELIYGVNFVCEDSNAYGIITTETLTRYGGDKVYLKKTTKTKIDEKGIERDVGLISFPFSESSFKDLIL